MTTKQEKEDRKISHQLQVSQATQAFEYACSKGNAHPLGHGYLWVRFADGNKELIGSIGGLDNHGEIISIVSNLPSVDHAWINLD